MDLTGRKTSIDILLIQYPLAMPIPQNEIILK